MLEEQGSILIARVAACPEVSRDTASDVWLSASRSSWPVEAREAIAGQLADSRRSAIEHFAGGIGKRLQNVIRWIDHSLMNEIRERFSFS
jgi:hypothetical protein